MNQKSLDQIHLCVNEMQMVKQLIDSKAADSFCNRLLGIYVMMRVDDVTKIWSHSVELGLRKPEFRQDEDFMVTLWRKDGSGTVQSDPESLPNSKESARS